MASRAASIRNLPKGGGEISMGETTAEVLDVVEETDAYEVMLIQGATY
jgi:hypothetical protein